MARYPKNNITPTVLTGQKKNFAQYLEYITRLFTPNKRFDMYIIFLD